MSHIFITYPYKTRHFAHEVYLRLEGAGLKVWMDDKLADKEIWLHPLSPPLREAYAMVVIVTPYTLTSPQNIYEWSYGLGRGLLVLPLLYESIGKLTPDHPLGGVQPLTFRSRKQPWDKLFEQLQAVVAVSPPDDLPAADQIMNPVQAYSGQLGQAITGILAGLYADAPSEPIDLPHVIDRLWHNKLLSLEQRAQLLALDRLNRHPIQEGE